MCLQKNLSYRGDLLIKNKISSLTALLVNFFAELEFSNGFPVNLRYTYLFKNMAWIFLSYSKIMIIAYLYLTNRFSIAYMYFWTFLTIENHANIIDSVCIFILNFRTLWMQFQTYTFTMWFYSKKMFSGAELLYNSVCLNVTMSQCHNVTGDLLL